MKRLLFVLSAVLVLVVGRPAAPAGAGGWAATYLDPLPAQFRPGVTYTVGFWVLQHGTHPFEGDLGKTGLRLSGEGGKALTFDGTALPEPGHYVTSIVVPQGTWKVEGVQGFFEEHDVGTLTVPGVLKVNPPAKDLRGDGKDYWGAIRPPGFPPGKGGPVQDPATAAAQAGGAAVTGNAAPGAAGSGAAGSGAPGSGAAGSGAVGSGAVGSGAAGSEGVGSVGAASAGGAGPVSEAGQGAGLPAYTLLLAGLGGAVLALLVVRLARRHPMDESTGPDKTDTITISG
ncbi:hypothetical protein [Nonomuraea typhae]|uniref:Htaa domain-containing protein n=1 Tax=Nonomuraea typhae TaxID=2603600 RepID=A0ABW7YM35_9ACTN